MRQAITKLLPRLKAHGVQTISFELPQSMIDDKIDTKTFAELRAKWKGEPESWIKDHDVESVFVLVKATQNAQLHVLGHELPLTPVESKKLYGKKPTAEDIEVTKNMKRAHPLSEEGYQQRNDYAANHIQENKRGKVIVTGGLHHSGEYTAEEYMMSCKGFDELRIEGMDARKRIDPNFFNPEILGLPPAILNPRGIPVEKDYIGLDVLLEYPSIDMNFVNPSGPIGLTEQTDGLFNTFEITLPKNLNDLKTNSWPPKDGVPNIEEIDAAEELKKLPTPTMPSRKALLMKSK